MSVGQTLTSKFKWRHMRHNSYKGAFQPRGVYPRTRLRHALANSEPAVINLFGTETANVVTFTNATNIVNLTSHGFVNGDGPFIFTNSGGALPAELGTNIMYWVTRVDDDTFTVSRDRLSAGRGISGVFGVTDDGTGTSSIRI